ncbi:MAG: hypothetical protein AAF720_01290 [Pseudomonadota bacterium]
MDLVSLSSATVTILAVLFALLVGLSIGWLRWGQSQSPKADNNDAKSRGIGRARADNDKYLSTIEHLQSEINDVKALLATGDTAKTLIIEELNEIDTAIQRANRRLNVMLSSDSS